jgi:hypothetical protein
MRLRHSPLQRDTRSGRSKQQTMPTTSVAISQPSDRSLRTCRRWHEQPLPLRPLAVCGFLPTRYGDPTWEASHTPRLSLDGVTAVRKLIFVCPLCRTKIRRTTQTLATRRNQLPSGHPDTSRNRRYRFLDCDRLCPRSLSRQQHTIFLHSKNQTACKPLLRLVLFKRWLLRLRPRLRPSFYRLR